MIFSKNFSLFILFDTKEYFCALLRLFRFNSITFCSYQPGNSTLLHQSDSVLLGTMIPSVFSISEYVFPWCFIVHLLFLCYHKPHGSTYQCDKFCLVL